MGDALGLLVLWLITTTAGLILEALPWAIPVIGAALLAAAVGAWLYRAA